MLTELRSNSRNAFYLMQKTILAVLDSCVNPDFPFIVQDPEQKKEEKEAWSKMGSTLPVRYHFYFQLLDGDDQGKPAKIYDDEEMREVEVTEFRPHSPSVFQLIADYADSSKEQVLLMQLFFLQARRVDIDNDSFCSDLRFLCSECVTRDGHIIFA